MPKIHNTQRITAIVIFSALILAAAWGYELIGGYAPCPLCLMQRYAYYFAVPAALVALFLVNMKKAQLANLVLILIGMGFVINAGLGIYHSGVEWHWWPGPSSCAASGANFASDATDILQKLKTSKVIRCDEAQWRMFGLSFAGYNLIFSLALALLCYSTMQKR